MRFDVEDMYGRKGYVILDMSKYFGLGIERAGERIRCDIICAVMEGNIVYDD